MRSRVMRRVCQLAATWMLIWVLGPVIPALAQGTNGGIAGTVADAQGGVLPGVTVTLRNADTGVARATVTEPDGRYRFPTLPSGR